MNDDAAKCEQWGFSLPRKYNLATTEKLVTNFMVDKLIWTAIGAASEQIESSLFDAWTGIKVD